MQSPSRICGVLLVWLLACAYALPAAAQTCTITGISGGSVNIGWYTGAAISKSLAGTSVTITRTGSGTTCRGQIAFQRSPASAVLTGGLGGTLAYDLQDSANSNRSLIASGGWTGTIPFTYSGSSSTFTVNLSTITAVVAAGTAPAAGGYADTTITIVAFDGNGQATTPVGSAAFMVSAAVNPSCSINGSAAASDPTPVQVPVSATSGVSQAAIQRSYASVLCNAPTDITMNSQNGGITHAAVVPPGLTNVIPYVAQASFGGATATLDTARASMVTGKLTALSGASGAMNVTITPQPTGLPLMSGQYDDTLTITLTPQ